MTTADLVINFSGGKDSSAMLHLLVSRYAATHRLHVVFADTGWEAGCDRRVGETPATGADAAPAATACRCTSSAIPRRTLLQEVAERGKFPSAGQRWCTAHHKRNPDPEVDPQPRRQPATSSTPSASAPRSRPTGARCCRQPRPGAEHAQPHRSSPGTRSSTWPLCEGLELPRDPRPARASRLRLPAPLLLPFCIFHRGRDLAAVRRHDPASFAIWSRAGRADPLHRQPQGSAVALADAWEESQRPKPAVTPAEWEDVDLGGLSQTSL